MTNWADAMIISYEAGRKELRESYDKLGNGIADQKDKSHINSMIGSMSEAIQWMRTGKDPEKIRGIEKHSVYQLDSMADMDIFPSLDIKPQERELTEEEKKEVYNALRVLSPRERQSFIFRHAYLWEYQDIAKELGVSISSVRMYLRRAEKKLLCHTDVTAV